MTVIHARYTNKTGKNINEKSKVQQKLASKTVFGLLKVFFLLLGKLEVGCRQQSSKHGRKILAFVCLFVYFVQEKERKI